MSFISIVVDTLDIFIVKSSLQIAALVDLGKLDLLKLKRFKWLAWILKILLVRLDLTDMELIVLT